MLFTVSSTLTKARQSPCHALHVSRPAQAITPQGGRGCVEGNKPGHMPEGADHSQAGMRHSSSLPAATHHVTQTHTGAQACTHTGLHTHTARTFTRTASVILTTTMQHNLQRVQQRPDRKTLAQTRPTAKRPAPKHPATHDNQCSSLHTCGLPAAARQGPKKGSQHAHEFNCACMAPANNRSAASVLRHAGCHCSGSSRLPIIISTPAAALATVLQQGGRWVHHVYYCLISVATRP